jgi:AbrB family looped-hinge helix DNA binding protein
MGSSNVMQSKVSTKGWVVIPAALRRRYRLQPGTIVEFREEGEKILIVPRESDPVESLFGKLAGRVSLTGALLEDWAAELEREESCACSKVGQEG